MINISNAFNQKMQNDQLHEYYANRKPIKDYLICIFSQFDFTTPEAEENISQVRVSKNEVENAEEFLKNVIRILGKEVTTAISDHMQVVDILPFIKNLTRNLKYDTNLEVNFIDAVKLVDDWDEKQLIVESDNEYIYLGWFTTA